MQEDIERRTVALSVNATKLVLNRGKSCRPSILKQLKSFADRCRLRKQAGWHDKNHKPGVCFLCAGLCAVRLAHWSCWSYSASAGGMV